MPTRGLIAPWPGMKDATQRRLSRETARAAAIPFSKDMSEDMRARLIQRQNAIALRDERRRKANPQASVLAQRREEETRRAEARARMALMAGGQAEAVRQLTALQILTARPMLALFDDVGAERARWAEEHAALHAAMRRKAEALVARY